MKTFEQIYESLQNIRRFYYHISPHRFVQFERRNNFRKGDDAKESGGIFLTPHLMMIQGYLTDYLIGKYDQSDFFLYKCLLTSPPNVFNPSDKVDRNKFLEEVRKNPEQFFTNYTRRQYRTVMEDLQREFDMMFSSHDWGQMENPEVTRVIRLLGYDGYVTKEHDVGNIMIFDPSFVKIVPYDKNGEVCKVLNGRKCELINRDIYNNKNPDYIGKEGCWDKFEWEEIKKRTTAKKETDNYSRRGAYDKSEFSDLGNISQKKLFSIIIGEDLPGWKKKEYSIVPLFDEKSGKLKQNLLDDLFANIKAEKEDPPYIFQGEEYDKLIWLKDDLIEKFGIIDVPETDNDDF